MRKVEHYVAYDGTIFETEKDCIEYENSEIDEAIQRVHRRMQQMKAGELAEEFKMFVRTRAAYFEVCRKRTTDSERLTKFSRYHNARYHYLQSVTEYQKLRRDYKKLKFDEKKKIETRKAKEEIK